MKIAKPYKILALLSVFIIATVCFFAVSFNSIAHAEVVGSNYFSGGNVNFSDDDKAVITFDESGSVSVKNKLDLSDFAITLYLPDMENGDTFTVKFITDSYLPTGNPLTEDGKTVYKTEIENKVVFTMDGTTLKAAFNGQNPEDVSNNSFTLVIGSDGNGYLSVILDYGATVTKTNLSYNDDAYYKVKYIPAVSGILSFVGTEGKTFKIETINQKYGDGTAATYEDNKFVQDFVMENGNFAHEADAKVYLADSLYNYNSDVNAYTAIYGYKYSATLTAYSFLGDSSSEYKMADGAYKIVDSNFAFNEKSNSANDLKTVQINKGDKQTGNYFEFFVIDFEKDEKAPVYVGSEAACKSFDAYVKDLVKTAKENGDDEISIEKEKLSALVEDDYTAFSIMSATVYYWSTNSNSSSSSLKISLKDAGDFRYIILFTDYKGNAMEKEQFFFSDNENPIVENLGIYGDHYIFGFTVEDNSKLSITTGSAGKGYKGVEYSCSAFTIEGDDYSVNYTLYYSATEIDTDADGWTEIIEASKADDEDKTYGAFTYDEIKAINYDGKLDFTPDRTGYYKFVCEVNSTDFIKGDTAVVVFEVKEQVKTVTPDTHWLENNVWSVVFLSIGTLSLIGIVVLLFIKPKDEGSDNE